MKTFIGPLTRNEVTAAANIHFAAFPEFFLSTLGPRFLRRLYRAFASSPDAITVVVRSTAGDLVGCAVGTTKPAGFFKSLAKKDALGFGFAALPAVARDPRRIGRVLRGLTYRGGAANAPAGALLSSICVGPQHQGTGQGRVLLEAWVAAAQAAGATSAYLQTDADNNAATNAFYVKCGWSLAGAETTPEGRRLNTYTIHFG